MRNFFTYFYFEPLPYLQLTLSKGIAINSVFPDKTVPYQWKVSQSEVEYFHAIFVLLLPADVGLFTSRTIWIVIIMFVLKTLWIIIIFL